MNMNISAVNNSEDIYKGNSVNIKENAKAKEGSRADLFSNVNLSGYDKANNKIDTNTYQSIMKDISSVEEQIKLSAETAKDSLKALITRMSGADGVKLDEEGYNLNDMSAEKMVTVVDRIKIMLATYCDDYVPMGDSIDKEAIEEVVGSKSMANKVASKLISSDLPASDENVEAVSNALEQAQSINPLTEQAKNYLVGNELAPSIKNIYTSEYVVESADYRQAVHNNSTELSDEQWSQLKSQVEKIISNAGLEINAQNIDNAKTFIINGIAVTEENLIYKAELDGLKLEDMQSNQKINEVLNKIVGNMSMGHSADTTLLTNSKTTIEMVIDAISTINNVNAKLINTDNSKVDDNSAKDDFVNKEYNIQNIKQYALDKNSDISLDITKYRQLEEIRILMTAEAGLSLANQGFNLNIMPIADIVEELKAMETQLYGDNATAIYEVKKAMYDIKNAPDVTVGAALIKSSYNAKITIGEFAELGNNLKHKYQQAESIYEAVGTEVRHDLGDNFNKAVAASTQDILNALGLEENQYNKEAIRILAANEMEISIENINKVKELYSDVRNLISNMKPDKVMSMIRDNINPMNADINEVNQYLQNIQNDSSMIEQKYSSFLYKLDRTKEITSEERKEFIGIYKMMNIFQKDAGVAVGALIKQGSELTMSNLITAYNSRKAAGIDTKVDDRMGMAEITGTVNYYNNIFSETAASITPRTLKAVNDEKNIMTRSVENFCESIQNSYDSGEEAIYYDEYFNEIQDLTKVENSIIKQLMDNNQTVSINNIAAMQNLMSNGVFTKYYNIKGDSKVKEIIDNFIDKTDSRQGLEQQYDKLDKSVKEAINNEIINSDNSQYADINTLRMMGKEIGLIKGLSRRQDYKIPFVSDNNEVGTINLKIIENQDNKGFVSIKFTNEKFGDVNIEAKVDKTKMEVITANSENKDLFREKITPIIESISDRLAGSEELEQEISTDKLYLISKEIIMGLLL